MELHQLFKIQDILENKIKNYVDIDENALGEENTFHLRFLAFQVKLGEIANLTKCYKYSKGDKEIPKDKLIFRYIDGMKFLLSIGNTHNFNIIDDNALILMREELHPITLFSFIYDDIAALRHAIQIGNYVDALSIYIRLFSRYIRLGKAFGLTFEEVYNHYISSYSS